MNLFVLNLVLATTWLFLSSSPNTSRFVIGFLLGFLLIVLFQHVYDKPTYIKKAPKQKTPYAMQVLWLTYFLLWFVYQFLIANIKIAWSVLSMPSQNITPHIFTIPLSDLTDFEKIFLSQCITLTPGTASVQITENKNTLYVHDFDVKDIGHARQSIEQLKHMMLKFTR